VVSINSYFTDGYWWLFILNYHMLLMVFSVVILLMVIGGYFIDGYWRLF
jgi:hypothetical protein